MKSEKEIYSHETLEFTTVAVSFCQLMEQAREQDMPTFVDRMLKLLPLLYLRHSCCLRWRLMRTSVPKAR